ncbi:MAG: hypothetical protein WBD03_03670 [Thermoplasmata archaeon]
MTIFQSAKKWFMLQVWRVQQVAQILTIVMLAISLTLQVYGYMQWREGTWFATPYVGGVLILLALAASIWGFAFLWDMRLRMWREQAAVLVERNPYAKEKWYAKEIVTYKLIMLPILEKLGEDDEKLESYAKTVRAWIDKSLSKDPATRREVTELAEFVGMDPAEVLKDRPE